MVYTKSRKKLRAVGSRKQKKPYSSYHHGKKSAAVDGRVPANEFPPRPTSGGSYVFYQGMEKPTYNKFENSFDRGNTQNNEFSEVGSGKANMPDSGPGVNGTIAQLKSNKWNHYGNRVTDGRLSQTGAKTGSKVGYQGNLDPIANLMIEAGYVPTKSASSYVASSEMAPDPYTTFDELGRDGIQPILRSSLAALQGSHWLPPDQGGTHRGKPGLKSMPLDTATRKQSNRSVIMQPYSQRSIHASKFGDDGDPNPVYPLAPVDPVEQESNILTTGKQWRERHVQWSGGIHQISEMYPKAEDANNYVEADKSELGYARSNEAMLQSGVQNYLWSTGFNRRSRV